MAELPSLSYREVARRLRALGFCLDRQARGSHEIWYNSVTRRRATVPRHSGDMPKGTLRAIISQTGVSEEDFLGCSGD